MNAGQSSALKLTGRDPCFFRHDWHVDALPFKLSRAFFDFLAPSSCAAAPCPVAVTCCITIWENRIDYMLFL